MKTNPENTEYEILANHLKNECEAAEFMGLLKGMKEDDIKVLRGIIIGIKLSRSIA